MTGTLRDRLAAVLGPGNDDSTAYAQADAVLEVLALETRQHGICGTQGPGMGWQCQLRAGHDGFHEHVVWPYAAAGQLVKAEHVHWGDQ